MNIIETVRQLPKDHPDGWHTTKEIGIKFGIAGAFIVGVAAVAKSVDHTDAASTFDRQYTKDGQCLNGTPFDTDLGAQVIVRDVDGQSTLTVLPASLKNADEHPELLNFTVTDNGLLRQPTIEPQSRDQSSYYVYGSDTRGNCGPLRLAE